MTTYPIVLSQSSFVEHDTLTYPFEERGLQFGDGVYEVIRIYQGEYYLFEEHLDRLFRSMDAIKIIPSFTKEECKTLLLQLLSKNNMNQDGKVYLQVTRGSAPRDHAFPLDTPANIYAYVENSPRPMERLTRGVGVITHEDARWAYCHIKSLNLLPNVLAKQEAKENGCYEAILHKNNLVTEGSSSNIYLVKNNTIYTHPATQHILYGCVRMRVEQFAKDLNIPFIEEAFTLHDMKDADELLLSSSTSEIQSIITVDGRKVGTGYPGPVTRKLLEAYEKDANIPHAFRTHTEPLS